MSHRRLRLYLIVTMLLLASPSSGKPVPKKHSKLAFGAGLFGGALAGVAIHTALANKTPTDQHIYHHFDQTTTSTQQPPINSPTIENGPLLPNGCYEQTLREPSLQNAGQYTETVHLVCPAGAQPGVVVPQQMPQLPPQAYPQQNPPLAPQAVPPYNPPVVPQIYPQLPQVAVPQQIPQAYPPQNPPFTTGVVPQQNTPAASQVFPPYNPPVAPQQSAQQIPQAVSEHNSPAAPQAWPQEIHVAAPQQTPPVAPQVFPPHNPPVMAPQDSSQQIPQAVPQHNLPVPPQAIPQEILPAAPQQIPTTQGTPPQNPNLPVPYQVVPQPPQVLPQQPASTQIYMISKKTGYYTDHTKSNAIGTHPVSFVLLLVSIIFVFLSKTM